MKSLLERYGLLAALVAMIAFFAIKEPNFRQPDQRHLDASDRRRSCSSWSAASTWIVATGKIDVSFYAVAALSNVVVASLVQGGWDWTTAYAVAVVIAVVVGFVNGYLISYLDLPDLVVTICSASFLVSLALVLSSGSSFGIDRPGWLFEFMHATVGDFVGREGTETAGGIGPVPLVLLVAVLVLAVTWFTQERLTFGHYIYAQGWQLRSRARGGRESAPVEPSFCSSSRRSWPRRRAFSSRQSSGRDSPTSGPATLSTG